MRGLHTRPLERGVQVRIPSLSMIAICVVSFEIPAESRPSEASVIGSGTAAAAAFAGPAPTLARQYGQSLTLESYLNGSPAMNEDEACCGSISAARSLA